MNLFPGLILFGLMLSFVHSIDIKDESVIEKSSFPLYSSITLGVQGIYAYFNQQSPVWVKVAWWGAFVAEDGGVIDSFKAVKTVYDNCNGKFKDPLGSDCLTDAADAMKSVLMNVVTLTVGWNAPDAINNVMIYGHYKRSFKGRINSHTNLVIILLFLIPFLPSLLFILMEILHMPR